MVAVSSSRRGLAAVITAVDSLSNEECSASSTIPGLPAVSVSASAPVSGIAAVAMVAGGLNIDPMMLMLMAAADNDDNSSRGDGTTLVCYPATQMVHQPIMPSFPQPMYWPAQVAATFPPQMHQTMSAAAIQAPSVHVAVTLGQKMQMPVPFTQSTNEFAAQPKIEFVPHALAESQSLSTSFSQAKIAVDSNLQQYLLIPSKNVSFALSQAAADSLDQRQLPIVLTGNKMVENEVASTATRYVRGLSQANLLHRRKVAARERERKRNRTEGIPAVTTVNVNHYWRRRDSETPYLPPSALAEDSVTDHSTHHRNYTSVHSGARHVRFRIPPSAQPPDSVQVIHSSPSKPQQLQQPVLEDPVAPALMYSKRRPLQHSITRMLETSHPVAAPQANGVFTDVPGLVIPHQEPEFKAVPADGAVNVWAQTLPLEHSIPASAVSQVQLPTPNGRHTEPSAYSSRPTPAAMGSDLVAISGVVRFTPLSAVSQQPPLSYQNVQVGSPSEELSPALGVQPSSEPRQEIQRQSMQMLAPQHSEAQLTAQVFTTFPTQPQSLPQIQQQQAMQETPISSQLALVPPTVHVPSAVPPAATAANGSQLTRFQRSPVKMSMPQLNPQQAQQAQQGHAASTIPGILQPVQRLVAVKAPALAWPNSLPDIETKYIIHDQPDEKVTTHHCPQVEAVSKEIDNREINAAVTKSAVGHTIPGIRTASQAISVSTQAADPKSNAAESSARQWWSKKPRD